MQIYGVQPLGEHGLDSCISWPPSLRRITGQAVTKALAKAILHQLNFRTHNLWKERDWQILRDVIHRDVPQSLLDEIYERDVGGSGHHISRSEPCIYCRDMKDYEDKELNSINLPRFMLAWILLDTYDYRLTHPDILPEDLDYLQTFESGMMAIIINSSEWINRRKPLSVKEKMESDLLIGTTEDLGKILDRQINLRMMTLNFDATTPNNSNLLQILARFSKLSKLYFTYRPHSWTCNTFKDFLDLIKSQAATLEDLAVFANMDKEQFASFWNLLADLPHLTRYTCSSAVFCNLPRPKPLKYLEVLAITNESVFTDFPVDALFPSLIELKLNMPDSFLENDLLEREFLQSQVPKRVTKIDSVCSHYHPFKWLSCWPHVTCASILQYNTGSRLVQPFEHVHLQELDLTCNTVFPYTDFKMFFQCFPNLVDLTLEVNNVSGGDDYNEEDFIDFLSGTDAKCSNLTSLSLKFNPPWKEMSGKSYVAIIKHSNIYNLRYLQNVSFSFEDVENLKMLTKSRNLKIMPVIQEGEISFICLNGQHIEIF